MLVWYHAKKGRYGKTIDRNIKGKEGVTGHEKTSLETDEKDIC